MDKDWREEIIADFLESLIVTPFGGALLGALVALGLLSQGVEQVGGGPTVLFCIGAGVVVHFLILLDWEVWKKVRR